MAATLILKGSAVMCQTMSTCTALDIRKESPYFVVCVNPLCLTCGGPAIDPNLRMKMQELPILLSLQILVKVVLGELRMMMIDLLTCGR